MSSEIRHFCDFVGIRPPRPSEHFSDLIQLNVIRNSSLLVTPLGFKPKTFRTGNETPLDCKYLRIRCL
nr:MAG TPA: hypothetical protein [Caudoviricetes sp.]